MRKYEFTEETKNYNGTILHRIKSLIDFGNVKSGEIGGWIEKEDNLCHCGDAWVCDDAQVFGNAHVFGYARVYGNARVFGDAWVYDNAHVFGYAQVYGNARVLGNALVCDAKCVFWISAIGSRNDTTTFFNCADGKIRVLCGCFYGDLEEFAEAVNKTHGYNEHGQVYRLAIEMAKKRIHTVCHEVKRNDQD